MTETATTFALPNLSNTARIKDEGRRGQIPFIVLLALIGAGAGVAGSYYSFDKLSSVLIGSGSSALLSGAVAGGLVHSRLKPSSCRVTFGELATRGSEEGSPPIIPIKCLPWVVNRESSVRNRVMVENDRNYSMATIVADGETFELQIADWLFGHRIGCETERGNVVVFDVPGQDRVWPETISE